MYASWAGIPYTSLSLFILSAIFQVNLGYPVFIEAKNDGSGGDNWSHKSCKAPVKSSPPTNRHPVFFTGRMPFLSPKQQSEHSNEIPYTNSPNSCSSTELLLLLTMYWFKWRCHANDAGALYRVIITVRKVVKLSQNWA